MNSAGEALRETERRRILAGDYSALKRPENPCMAVGDCLVVLWGRERRHVTDRDTGAVTVTPAHPLVWVEVSHPPFLRAGQWVVRFHVVDRRDPARLLQGGSPSSLTDESARGYGSGAARAIDDSEAVDDATLDRFSIENQARHAIRHPEQVDAEEARRLLNTLAKIQREAAKLGVKVTPDLQAAIDATQEKIIQHRKAA